MAPPPSAARACAGRLLAALRLAAVCFAAAAGLSVFARVLPVDAVLTWAEGEGRQLLRSQAAVLTVVLRELRARWLAPSMQVRSLGSQSREPPVPVDARLSKY